MFCKNFTYCSEFIKNKVIYSQYLCGLHHFVTLCNFGINPRYGTHTRGYYTSTSKQREALSYVIHWFYYSRGSDETSRRSERTDKNKRECPVMLAYKLNKWF